MSPVFPMTETPQLTDVVTQVANGERCIDGPQVVTFEGIVAGMDYGKEVTAKVHTLGAEQVAVPLPDARQIALGQRYRWTVACQMSVSVDRTGDQSRWELATASLTEVTLISVEPLDTQT